VNLWREKGKNMKLPIDPLYYPRYRVGNKALVISYLSSIFRKEVTITGLLDRIDCGRGVIYIVKYGDEMYDSFTESSLMDIDDLSINDGVVCRTVFAMTK